MKTIILKVASTEVYTPERLVKIIGDALEADGIGDAYIDITVFTPPDQEVIDDAAADSIFKNLKGKVDVLQRTKGFQDCANWFKSLLQ